MCQNMVTTVVSTILEKVLSDHFIKNQNFMPGLKEVINDFTFPHVKQLRPLSYRKITKLYTILEIYATVEWGSGLRSAKKKTENGYKIIFALKHMVMRYREHYSSGIL